MVTNTTVRPDTICYNTLVAGYAPGPKTQCTTHAVQRSLGALRTLCTGCVAQVVTRITIYGRYASRERWADANKLLDQMSEADVAADQWTYGPLLEACRRGRHRGRARTYGRRCWPQP